MRQRSHRSPTSPPSHSPIGKPERATQNRVIDLFRDELRYRYLGDRSDRQNSNIDEPLLTAYLTKAGYAPEQISRAIYLLRTEADNPNRSLMGVQVTRFFVQQMKTKWGSSNPRTSSIRLNTDLAKKPRECLEYIVAHEMVHLQVPTHNARFMSLMDEFMPRWQSRRDMLNRLPVRHEEWG